MLGAKPSRTSITWMAELALPQSSVANHVTCKSHPMPSWPSRVSNWAVKVTPEQLSMATAESNTAGALHSHVVVSGTNVKTGATESMT